MVHIISNEARGKGCSLEHLPDSAGQHVRRAPLALLRDKYEVVVLGSIRGWAALMFGGALACASCSR